MSIFLKMVRKGLKRRKKEMRYVSVVTFIAVLFMSSITMFQNIMDRYLMETNYQNYGDWVLSAVKDYQDPGVLFSEISHPYLAASGVCRTGEMLLDKKNEKSGVSLGTVDNSVREFGNISLYEGRFPEAEDEIAMDLSSLSVLGYSYDLGQSIRVAVQKEEGIFEKEFRLVGTVKSFAENWKHLGGYYLPNGIVTEEGMKTVCEPLYATYFYQLDRKYEDLNMEEFTTAFMKPGFMRMYNSYVYENRIWGSREMFQAVEFILIFIGALAVGYLMMSYVSQRRKWYYQLRCTGADQAQIRMMILTETVSGTFPCALAAMILPYLAGALICYGVSVNLKIPYFFVFHPEEFFRQLGAALGVILFSILCAWLGSRDQRLERNTEEVTKRQVKRLRRDSKKKRNVAKIFLRRQRKLHPYQNAASIVFSFAVCFLLILCLNRIYQTGAEYQQQKIWFPYDFEAHDCITIEQIRGDRDLKDGYGGATGDFYDMYHGIDEVTVGEIASLIGIEKTKRQVWDQTHILQWENKKDSPIEQALKKGYENDTLSIVAPVMFQYYEDSERILEELKKGYPEECKQLDENAFREGKEIILMLQDFDISFTGDNGKLSETTIHCGDEVEIVGAERSMSVPLKLIDHLELPGLPEETVDHVDLPGYTPVKVGAVIRNPSIAWISKRGLHDVPYGIFGSEKLAERVAQADGQEIKSNRISVDLNKNQSFESTQKRLASIFEENGIGYWSNMEEIQEARNAYIRKSCIYGILFTVILFIFLLLQVHFHQIQNQHREREYRLLKQLGMEHTFFRLMTVKEGMMQAVWMLLAVPCSYGIMAYMHYLTAKKDCLEGVQIWSEPLGDFTGDPYWITLDRMRAYTNLGNTMVFVILLILGVVGIGYFSARKKEESV